MSDEKPKLKLVRAKRTGSYHGHRRRTGSVFVVPADAKEVWFEDAGPAPEGAELPSQLQTAQAPIRKTFIGVMKELGRQDLEVKPVVAPEPQTLAEVPVPPVDNNDLV